MLNAGCGLALALQQLDIGRDIDGADGTELEAAGSTRSAAPPVAGLGPTVRPPGPSQSRAAGRRLSGRASFNFIAFFGLGGNLTANVRDMSEPPPTLVRIFISSPSDVAEERRVAAELIEYELAK